LLVYLSVPLHDIDALVPSLLLLAPVLIATFTRILRSGSKVLGQKRP